MTVFFILINYKSISDVKLRERAIFCARRVALQIRTLPKHVKRSGRPDRPEKDKQIITVTIYLLRGLKFFSHKSLSWIGPRAGAARKYVGCEYRWHTSSADP